MSTTRQETKKNYGTERENVFAQSQLLWMSFIFCLQTKADKTEHAQIQPRRVLKEVCWADVGYS